MPAGRDQRVPGHGHIVGEFGFDLAVGVITFGDFLEVGVDRRVGILVLVE